MRLVNRLKKEWVEPFAFVFERLPILLGVFLLWLRRPDGVLISGYGWPNALRNAWLIAEGQTRHYDYFRDPLYSVLLNALTPVSGTYALAAEVLGWGIAIGTWILLCGIVKRLSGTAGVWWLLYALTQAPLLLSMSVHANTYPLSALTLLWCFGASIAYVQCPNRRHQLMLWASFALALCADGRAMALLPLGLWGLWQRGRNPKMRIQQILLFISVIWGVPELLDLWCALEPEKLAAHHVGMLHDFQQSVAQRWALVGTDLRMAKLCEPIAQSDFLTLSFLGTDCARAILSHNLTERWPLVLYFPWWQLWGGAVLSVLLCRGSLGWTIGLGALGLWVASALTVLPPRYLLQLGPLMMVFLCVGLGRLSGGLPQSVFPIFGMLLFAFGYNRPPPQVKSVFEHALWETDWQGLNQRIPVGTAAILDCSSGGLGLGLYPQHRLALRPERDQAQAAQLCEGTLPASLVIRTDSHSSWKLLWSTSNQDFHLYSSDVP